MWPRYEPVDMGAANSSRYRLHLYRDDDVTAHKAGMPHSLLCSGRANLLSAQHRRSPHSRR